MQLPFRRRRRPWGRCVCTALLAAAALAQLAPVAGDAPGAVAAPGNYVWGGDAARSASISSDERALASAALRWLAGSVDTSDGEDGDNVTDADPPASTTTATTTSTGLVAGTYGAVTIEGEISLTVSDVPGFAGNAQVNAAAVSSVAAWTNASTSMIEVTFVAARLLRDFAQDQRRFRRLASGAVVLQYLIEIPMGGGAQVTAMADSITVALQTLDLAAATAALQSSISDQVSGAFFTVTVDAIGEPRRVVVRHTTTITSTTTTTPALANADQVADTALAGASSYTGLVVGLVAGVGCCCCLAFSRMAWKAGRLKRGDPTVDGDGSVMDLRPGEAGASPDDNSAWAAAQSDLRKTASREWRGN